MYRWDDKVEYIFCFHNAFSISTGPILPDLIFIRLTTNAEELIDLTDEVSLACTTGGRIDLSLQKKREKKNFV